MKHEANIIKLLAALSAIPRWITALIPADRTRFAWGDAYWWSIASACLSVLFAVVETYAAAFIMRAWRREKPGSDAERVLLVLWLVILVVLVCIMAPTVYVNTMRIEFYSLPPLLISAWSICIAASTFLVIGGVGYSERQVSGKTETATELPQVSVSVPELVEPEPKTWRQLTEDERGKVVELSVDEIMAQFGVSERTARNWRAHE